jgi:hypothetical protein
MGVAIVCGYLPVTYLGLSPWLCLPAGALALYAFLRLFGQRADTLLEDAAQEHDPAQA